MMQRIGKGRRVAVHELSDGPSDRIVVFCHPAPGAGNLDPDPEQTWSRGIRLIGVDRPDSVHPGEWTTVASAADDIACVLDGIGSGPVGVAGWSAGGRVALALAARRPELVDRVVVLATPAPDDEVEWIPEELRAVLDALRDKAADDVHAALAVQLDSIVPNDPGSDEALRLLGAGPADDSVLRLPGFRERLTTMLQAAFSQGSAGMAADIAGHCLQPWGFDPGEVGAKILLLYGMKDPVAAHRHAKWWDTRLPDSRVEMAPGGGHLAIGARWKRTLSHLAPGSKRA